MAGIWLAVVGAVAIGVALRRWWSMACSGALVCGAVVGGLHAAEVAGTTLPDAGVYELAVELSSSPRPHEGAGGPWWSAEGQIAAGGPRARVSLTGAGEPPAAMGDTLSARMVAGPALGRGRSGSLRLLERPRVTSAEGPTATARALMRQVSGSSDAGWLLSGITVGSDQGLSAETAEDMRSSGLTHLTAVSGANCAILLVLVHWIGGWLRIPRTPRALLAVIVLVGFVMVVGPQASVLRASVMAALSLGAGLVGGRRSAAHVLQMSAVLLLLVDPWLAYSVGFMLSIAATAGLIALIDRGPVAPTLAAQIATFPILLAVGGEVGPRTVAANVLVAPLAAVVPVLGLSALSAQWLLGWGAIPAAIGRGVCTVILHVASWDALPDLSWLPGWRGVLMATLVTTVVFGLGRRHLVIVSAVMVAVIGSTVRLADGWPPRDWWIVACDVGQGDAFVMRSGDGIVVVDAGPEPEDVEGCLDRLGVDHVDLLVLSHFHADHVGGLPGVFSRPVGQVWISPCHEPAEQYADAQRWFGRVPVSTPGPGVTATVSDMYLNVVWPERIIRAGSVPNNASLSVVFSSPHGSAAFLGDVEPEAQTAILASNNIDVDVVKVPHHGSAQFDPRLPVAISARVALVGVGEGNTFGHPAPEAVSAWQQSGSSVYTTAQNGDIAVTVEQEVTVRGTS